MKLFSATSKEEGILTTRHLQKMEEEVREASRERGDVSRRRVLSRSPKNCTPTSMPTHIE